MYLSKLLKVTGNNYPTSLPDAETSKLVRNLEGHSQKIATLAWNNRHILTSRSHEKSIINHAGNKI